VPHPHLQSFFLAFGPRALGAPVLRAIFDGMHALPTKELVIDAYETVLTRQLAAAGLTATALFPPLYDDPLSADDTLRRWRELVDAGFPFVKASLLRAGPQAEQVRACAARGCCRRVNRHERRRPSGDRPDALIGGAVHRQWIS
jgi:lipopolysaccharide biosynthesis protein